MATNTVDQALITQFSSNVHVKAQQSKSRLRDNVIIKPMIGDLFAYDGLEQVETREVNARHADATFDDVVHNRRKIARRRFIVNLPVDDSDVRAVLQDITGEYADVCVRAMNRRFDRVVVEAAFADVFTGRDFDTTVSFASDGGNTVNATTGLTYEKLLEIKKFWTNNEVGTEQQEDFMLLLTGTEEEALMLETELTSGDFTRSKPVDEGQMARAVGMKIIVYGADVAIPMLFVSGGGIRDNVAMTGRSVCIGLSKDMSIKVQDRVDKVETKQVQVISQLGGVRTEGLLMQKVQTTS